MACPLCQDQTASIPEPTNFTSDVKCPNCGHFQITVQARTDLNGKDAIAFDLASWVYGQTQLGQIPRIETKDIDLIKTYPRPTTRKRAELYLGRIIQVLNGNLMRRFEPADPRLKVASWCFSNSDAGALAEYLTELGAVKPPTQQHGWLLVAKGHEIYDEMTVGRIVSSQVFVAMSFSEAMKEAYEKRFS